MTPSASGLGPLVRALDHFDYKRKRFKLEGGGAYTERVASEPEERGQVHAVHWTHIPAEAKVFERDWSAARCGAWAKVVLPETFDRQDVDVCPDCAALVRRDELAAD